VSRYVVSEISGWRIEGARAGTGGPTRGRTVRLPPIACAVLDTAISHCVVAEYAERRAGDSKSRGPILSASEARQAAHAKARELNDREASAPDDDSPIPRLHVGLEALA
jgi:hypothetical protein